MQVTQKTFAGAAGVLLLAASANAGGLILNEWNAVGSQKWLGNPSTIDCEGPQGEDCADDDDVFFGRVMGNGGNWLEFVVTEDHLDIRGWEIRWAEEGNSDTTGDDIWFGIGSIRQGIITFADDPAWANLRSGTIITITEQTTAEGGLDTDFSFDPCDGDWWINVNSYDAQYITTVHNRIDRPEGYFSVDNDDWQGSIYDSEGNQIQGPIGENVPGWQAGGINSREVGKLEADPMRSVSIGSYDDSNSSTFGSPNRWSETISVFPLIRCRLFQDFRHLRQWTEIECACSTVILNEYNAVREDRFLNGGDENFDDDNGQAEDSFFGRVMGNGGNWFELVTNCCDSETVDMRNWVLHWQEVRDGTSGNIVLSDDDFWAAVPAGTILTFIENNSAQGGLDSVVDFSLPGGNWININTFDTQYVDETTSNVADPTWGEGFTAFTNGDTGQSFGIRERGETDLRDSRLFLQYTNTTGETIVGFNVSYDVECWYHGARANRIRMKYNTETSGFSNIDDLISTDNPLGPGGGGVPVDGSLSENRVQVDASFNLVAEGYDNLADGETTFFRWQYSNLDGGENGNPRSGLAINNIVIEPILAGGGTGMPYMESFNGYVGTEASIPSNMFVTGEDGDGLQYPGPFDPFTGISNVNSTGGFVSGEFRTSNRDWSLTILNASGNVVFGPAGQGAPGWGGRGVNTLNTGILQDDTSGLITPGGHYNESINSTFGSPNLWPTCTNPVTLAEQNLAGSLECQDGPSPCLGDLNGDGVVDVSDMLLMLSEWGACGQCDADLNNDGVVDVSDLLLLLSAWGPC